MNRSASVRLLAALSILVPALLAAVPAEAASLHLTLSPSGADSVDVQVTGADPHASLKLQYTDGYGVDRTYVLGTADAEGFLDTDVSTSARNVATSSNVSVIEPSTGAVSAQKRWPVSGPTAIALSASSLALPVGQNGSVSVTNPAGKALTVSTSNAAAASVSLDGATLDISGKANGTAVVTVCGDGSDCETLTLTVGTGGGNGGGLDVSLAAPVLVVGATANVYISGPTHAYYVSSNSVPRVAQATMSQNLVIITGFAAGSTDIVVCDPNGTCSTLAVTVLTAPTGRTTGAPILSRESLALAVGESGTILAAGSGSITASSNNAAIATSTVAQGTHVIVTGMRVGTATVSICDASGNCSYVSVSVSPAPPAPAPTGATSSGAFTTYLKPGQTSSVVLALQKLLAALGYMKVTPNGHFGPATTAAVKAFQKAKGIQQLGVVGPSTRAALNAILKGS